MWQAYLASQDNHHHVGFRASDPYFIRNYNIFLSIAQEAKYEGSYVPKLNCTPSFFGFWRAKVIYFFISTNRNSRERGDILYENSKSVIEMITRN